MSAGLYLGVVRVDEQRAPDNNSDCHHHTSMHPRSSHSIRMDSLTSNGIDRMRKDMLLRTCADGFPFSRYANQPSMSPV